MLESRAIGRDHNNRNNKARSFWLKLRTVLLAETENRGRNRGLVFPTSTLHLDPSF